MLVVEGALVKAVMPGSRVWYNGVLEKWLIAVVNAELLRSKE